MPARPTVKAQTKGISFKIAYGMPVLASPKGEILNKKVKSKMLNINADRSHASYAGINR